VYLAVLEVLLRRPLQGMGILDDTDYINSPLALSLFLEVIAGGTNHIRHKAL